MGALAPLPCPPRTAAGHPADPVRAAAGGAVLGGPHHLLVPVCGLRYHPLPLQDPLSHGRGKEKEGHPPTQTYLGGALRVKVTAGPRLLPSAPPWLPGPPLGFSPFCVVLYLLGSRTGKRGVRLRISVSQGHGATGGHSWKCRRLFCHLHQCQLR